MPGEKPKSDKAVVNATGKTWQEWFSLLDELGAGTMSHKEIASMLFDRKLVANPWWCQSITVAYERFTGRRITGQITGGFEIGAQKTFPVPAEKTWQIMTSTEGLAIWLANIESINWIKGSDFKSSDGTEGTVRVYNRGVNIRMTWKLPGWQKPSILQVRVNPKGEKSVISFHQENLPSEEMRDEMRKRWQEALNKLLELI